MGGVQLAFELARLLLLNQAQGFEQGEGVIGLKRLGGRTSNGLIAIGVPN